MEKTKAKSVHVFNLRLWSSNYFIDKGMTLKQPPRKTNIYDGLIIDAKSKKELHFSSPAEMMKCIEQLYKKDEKNIQEIKSKNHTPDISNSE